MKTIHFFRLILLFATLPMWIACGSDDNTVDPDKPNQDDPDPDNPIEVVDISAEDLVGHWQCITQKWIEAGEKTQSSYDITKDEYYIQFNDDMTGVLDSGEDQLMEIMGKQTFTWSVSKGIITFGKSETDKWYIKEFSDNKMTLYWVDGEYNITCEFKKDAGGSYKPILGPQIVHIDNYYLRGTKKDMDTSHDFTYDSQGRIKEWKTTSYSGSGYVDIQTFSYVGNFVIINENTKYSIGENGYLKIDNKGVVPQINGEKINKLTYNNDGYIATIEYGDEALRKGTINFQYEESGCSSTLKSFYNDETFQYIYNVEFPNNTSVNLVPLYTSGGYLGYSLTCFDIVGKRLPFLPREYTRKDHRNYTHKQFIFQKDKEGRITQIKEVTDLSPQVWDIYYEGYTDNPTDNPTEDVGKIADAIDLGLNVKWASWNIGASKPDDYGSLYAWGIPNVKPGYAEGDRPNNIKEISGTEYDIARSKWGGSWRLPTAADQAELVSKCKWELAKLNNIVGLKVTGPNGNSIFLPAGGYQNKVSIIDRGDTGYYWSGTRDQLGSKKLYPSYLFFTTLESQINWIWSPGNAPGGTYDLNYRIAMSIRPVCD